MTVSSILRLFIIVESLCQISKLFTSLRHIWSPSKEPLLEFVGNVSVFCQKFLSFHAQRIVWKGVGGLIIWQYQSFHQYHTVTGMVSPLTRPSLLCSCLPIMYWSSVLVSVFTVTTLDDTNSSAMTWHWLSDLLV